MLLYLAGLASCARYAILYSGTRDFYNYRFQADAFTIYNQLLDRGFEKENIFLYAYDDIATDSENPYKGKAFHEIHHKKNVYPGTDAIRLKGKDVTPQAFYDSITSLPSTSEDYVFILYGGSGGKGVLSAPNDDLIIADDLSKALSTAATSNLYKQCLFFIEASFAGSTAEVFTAPNLAVITTANDEESSYAAAYDTVIKAYLSNECSYHMISILDKQPTITVGELFTQIKQLTLESHVCYYGDESIKDVPISTFFGTPSTFSKLVTHAKSSQKGTTFIRQSKASFSARTTLQQLRRKAQKEKINTVLDSIVKYVDPKNYEQIMKDTNSKITPTYFQVLRVFQQKFGKINPNEYDRLNVLKALSATHSKDEIVQAIYSILK